MKKIFLVFFIFILFFGIFGEVQARPIVPCGGCERYGPDPSNSDKIVCLVPQPDCTFCHLFVLFQNVINFLLFSIVPPLAILMIAIAGFMYIFAYMSSPEILPGGASGGPKMLSQAKKLLTSVVIGLLLVYGAWIFVNTFLMLIGINEAHFKRLPQDWWKIN
ncbi:MAG: TrbC/VirB2 family protein, partial [Candidatus Nealsonbacteria bacterium]|nr:TrbC/VirB2 family protein [Candidatus Nealsonbacteria bacterium]